MTALSAKDADTHADIVSELEFTPEVDAVHIGVAIDQGVVTLTGHVASYSEKLAAIKAVQHVKGVRAIADEIVVRLPNHKQCDDDEIARRVADILKWDAAVPADAIRVTVHDGWVNLEGEVEWQFQRTAVQSQVTKLSGLVGLINNITVKNRPGPADIRQSIETALRRNAHVHPEQIHLSVRDNGTVVLDGDVTGWMERAAVEDTAWSVPGVTGVENCLAVRH